MSNFKTFQVYSSLPYHEYLYSLRTISKLFKFTVHKLESNVLYLNIEFQNFSSLQFIFTSTPNSFNHLRNFKTFQVYSSSEINKTVLKEDKNFKTFQVYSS